MHPEQRRVALNLCNIHLDPDCALKWLTTEGTVALVMGWITVEQVALILDVEVVSLMLSDNGLIVLREGLVTMKQVLKMPTPEHIFRLLKNNGIVAMREGLLTAEQVLTMPTMMPIFYLLQDNGIVAMREGLLTAEQALSMPTMLHVFYLLQDSGIVALREGLLTVQQVMETADSHKLESLLKANGMATVHPEQHQKLMLVYHSPLHLRSTKQKRPRSPTPPSFGDNFQLATRLAVAVTAQARFILERKEWEAQGKAYQLRISLEMKKREAKDKAEQKKREAQDKAEQKKREAQFEKKRKRDEQAVIAKANENRKKADNLDRIKACVAQAYAKLGGDVVLVLATAMQHQLKKYGMALGLFGGILSTTNNISQLRDSFGYFVHFLVALEELSGDERIWLLSKAASPRELFSELVDLREEFGEALENHKRSGGVVVAAEYTQPEPTAIHEEADENPGSDAPAAPKKSTKRQKKRKPRSSHNRLRPHPSQSKCPPCD